MRLACNDIHRSCSLLAPPHSGSPKSMDPPQLVVATLLYSIYYLQFHSAIGLSTIPPVENEGTVILARRENETNVPIYCRVSLNGSTFSTAWYLTRFGEVQFRITFGSVPTPNFVLEGVTSNLTIQSFSRDLDKVIVRCSNVAVPELLENGRFQLRIIG